MLGLKVTVAFFFEGALAAPACWPHRGLRRTVKWTYAREGANHD
jgi:hypothetical protein